MNRFVIVALLVASTYSAPITNLAMYTQASLQCPSRGTSEREIASCAYNAGKLAFRISDLIAGFNPLAFIGLIGNIRGIIHDCQAAECLNLSYSCRSAVGRLGEDVAHDIDARGPCFKQKAIELLRTLKSDLETIQNTCVRGVQAQ